MSNRQSAAGRRYFLFMSFFMIFVVFLNGAKVRQNGDMAKLSTSNFRVGGGILASFFVLHFVSLS